MTILYNCKTDGTEWRITKFSDFGEVESSYLCSADECQCPAGHRHTCRHRQMLPMFINRGAVDSFWFLDWDRKGWVSNEPQGYRGFDSETAYKEHYSNIENYKDELSSMEEYAREAACERSELGSSSSELTDEQIEGIALERINPLPERWVLENNPSPKPSPLSSIYDASILELPDDIRSVREMKIEGSQTGRFTNQTPNIEEVDKPTNPWRRI